MSEVHRLVQIMGDEHDRLLRRVAADLGGGQPPASGIAGAAIVIEGETVTVRAAATDDIAVAAVTFSRDGQDVFVDTSAPFEYSFVVPTGGPQGRR